MSDYIWFSSEYSYKHHTPLQKVINIGSPSHSDDLRHRGKHNVSNFGTSLKNLHHSSPLSRGIGSSHPRPLQPPIHNPFIRILARNGERRPIGSYNEFILDRTQRFVNCRGTTFSVSTVDDLINWTSQTASLYGEL